MLYIRVAIVNNGFKYLAVSLLIALRYSAVRRQFRNISGQKEEVQLLDYQTQQFKLFPLLANCFAQAAASDIVSTKFYQMLEDIKTGNFKLLDLLHHYTSGMKSIYTDDVMKGMLTVRQSIGGAGYSAWSGIPRLIEDYSPMVTFEGDNTMMAHQCMNFLMKQAKKAATGKDRTKVDGPFAYLSEMENALKSRCSASNPEHFLNIDLIDQALKVNVSFKLTEIMKKQKDSKVSKKDFINVHCG